MRSVPAAEGVSGWVADLRRDGIVVIPGFLTPEHFERVCAESTWLGEQRDSITCWHHGPTLLEEMSIGSFDPLTLPAIHAFYDDPRLRAVITAAEKRPLTRLAEAGKREYLTHGADVGECDPQTDLHSDIFFATHKAWFYLADVDVDDGPLAYVTGSHRATRSRLGFIYRDSWQRRPGSDPSRRISEEERTALDARERVMVCRANTLVVVNTCGYHRRLPGRPGRTRRALHLSVRANPFAPHGLHLRLARYPVLYDFVRRTKRAWVG